MADIVDFGRRVAEIRQIAEGIYDKAERKAVLDFVSDVEELVGKTRLGGQLGARRVASKLVQRRTLG
jgi:hypothetical protein